MILEYKKTLSFICPECSCRGMHEISVFEINSKKIELLCPNECDDYCVRINKVNDKYDIKIQCPVCGDTHSFSLKIRQFWSKKFIALRCPCLMMDICFIGSRDAVENYSEQQDNMLDELERMSIDKEDDELSVYEAILKRIEYLLSTGGIRCSCGNNHIYADIDDDFNINLHCSECGQTEIIQPDDNFLAYILLNDTLTIN